MYNKKKIETKLQKNIYPKKDTYPNNRENDL